MTHEHPDAHDIGGRPAGAIDPADGPPFHHEWEARIFAINRVLLARGAYTLDQFRDALERSCADGYASMDYYERWVVAIETLMRERQIA